ncbi:MAG: FAD-dependent oxidoreductase, partial [Erythrobacter sp.]|nr:FAD-dependent oxidoreductase [Erythrobacter sp.]
MAARDFDGVVVGGGIVGLACAAELARRGRSVLIVERASGVATGISARNCEVIHAVIYDPPGSLKAELCVAGQRMLYERCA